MNGERRKEKASLEKRERHSRLTSVSTPCATKSLVFKTTARTKRERGKKRKMSKEEKGKRGERKRRQVEAYPLFTYKPPFPPPPPKNKEKKKKRRIYSRREGEEKELKEPLQTLYLLSLLLLPHEKEKGGKELQKEKGEGKERPLGLSVSDRNHRPLREKRKKEKDPLGKKGREPPL